MSTVAIAHMVGEGIAGIMDGWAHELMNYAEKLGHNVIDMNGPAISDKLTTIFQDIKPDVLVYLYPGKWIYLFDNSYLKALSSIAVITYSNEVDVPEIIKDSSTAFVGFSENLIVVSDKYETQDIFKECLLSLTKRVLDGQTIGAAVNATRSDLLNAAKKYRNNEYIAVPLFYNRKYLTLLGDPNWSLTPKEPYSMYNTGKYLVIDMRSYILIVDPVKTDQPDKGVVARIDSKDEVTKLSKMCEYAATKINPAFADMIEKMIEEILNKGDVPKGI